MSDVISKRRIFSEARRKLKLMRESVDAVKSTSAKTQAQAHWDLLRHAYFATKETVLVRRTVTLLQENLQESISREERKREVGRLKTLVEALQRFPDPEESGTVLERQNCNRRKVMMSEVHQAAESLQAGELAESVPDVMDMMTKLRQLQEEFESLETEGTAVAAMEMALESVRMILEIAEEEHKASFEKKALLEERRQAAWKEALSELEPVPEHEAEVHAPERIPSKAQASAGSRKLVPQSPAEPNCVGEDLRRAEEEEKAAQDRLSWSASTVASAGWTSVHTEKTESPWSERWEEPPPPPKPRKPLALPALRGPAVRRLERRSLASIHMRRAGGRTLEAVLAWRQRHGLRQGEAAEKEQRCICMHCLESLGTHDSRCMVSAKVRSRYASRRLDLTLSQVST